MNWLDQDPKGIADATVPQTFEKIDSQTARRRLTVRAEELFLHFLLAETSPRFYDGALSLGRRIVKCPGARIIACSSYGATPRNSQVSAAEA